MEQLANIYILFFMTIFRVVSTTNNFARFLEYLLKLLQKKDTNDFFANPVNDQFAPGYSSIIKQPMDFSTIRSKLKPEGATNTVISSYPNLQVRDYGLYGHVLEP